MPRTQTTEPCIMCGEETDEILYYDDRADRICLSCQRKHKQHQDEEYARLMQSWVEEAEVIFGQDHGVSVRDIAELEQRISKKP